MSREEGGEGNTQQDSEICGMSNHEISCDESSENRPGSGLKSQTVLAAPASSDKHPQEGDQPAVDAVQGSHGITNNLPVWSEEERRKKINDLFTNLHSVLPHLSADDEFLTVIEEFTIFSRSLEGTLGRLERDKERMGKTVVNEGYAMDSKEALLSGRRKQFSAANFPPEIFSAPLMQDYKFCWASPNAVLSVAGDHAHISICSDKSPGLLFGIAKVLEVHNLAVVSQYVSSDPFKDVIMIHIKANMDYGQLVDTQITERVFKLAMDDIMQWIS
ncbi:unnamed protein product [Spirodela intermedia]|uniref:Uncharacterized protein n=1 Tax=Spirodela intermedia TaxID=51605 RepID=A0A7I8L5C8_SPIIN|nr:unnamed protein product [Spirodela intermedia]